VQQALKKPDLPERSVQLAPWPYFDLDEIEAVDRVLRNGKVNYWTGIEGRTFEREFAQVCGCRHGVAVANGTVALELALHALGIGPGDEVIVSPRTFVASASAVVMRGARPVFADVDRTSQNLTAATVHQVVTPWTKAIVAVHLAGWPCDIDPLLDLARVHQLKIVEDCAQAHGASYKGRPVGSLADIAAFSFCNDKIMTTGGEGGMVVTNNEDLWKVAWEYKDHGKSWDAVHSDGHGVGYRWLHHSFGTNWRMTEMQAAIGRVQLKKLTAWLDTRRRYADILNDQFRSLAALRCTFAPAEIRHAYYKYYVFLQPERLRPGWNRDRIISRLGTLGIPCASGSCSEVYRERAFDGGGLRPAHRLPVAKELGETSLMFPVHPTLDEGSVRAIALTASNIIAGATR
jgi:dTDP-4-amino-4,6-dideoxygalactose transaminase